MGYIDNDKMYQALNKCVFKSFLKQSVLIAHLMSFDKLFHVTVAPLSLRGFPYRAGLYLSGTIDVVLSDLRGQFGWYQLSRSHM